MDLIKSLWRGNVSLAKTFWLFYFGINLLFSVAIKYFLILNEQTLSTRAGYISFLVLVIFVLIYAPFILISTWRSANNYQGLQRYAIAAKLMVLLGWSRYITELLSIFVDKSG
jgi:hypothetical protein